MTNATLRIGSRGSDLALWQARYVATRLGVESSIVIIKTQGDQIQHLSLDKVEGKGFFTKEIETALLAGDVDLAVHSYKDLPIDGPPGLTIAAVPTRGSEHDVLVWRGATRATSAGAALASLPPNARIGTSSLRRKAQLLALRRDLTLVDLRGNVPTRVDKVRRGELSAIVVAQAGLERLNLLATLPPEGVQVAPFALDELCPAPAQGALAVQVRAADARTQALVQPLHDPATAQAVIAERQLLGHFGGGCHLPLGAYAEATPNGIRLTALVAAPDGSERLVSIAEGSADEVVQRAYSELIKAGAARYL